MGKTNFDLEERTTVFSEKTIILCQKIKLTAIVEPIVKQLVRSVTSVGANYCEANNAASKKDFRNKIFICKKEIRETRYWLRIFKKTVKDAAPEIGKLEQEGYELNLIFQRIITSLDNQASKID